MGTFDVKKRQYFGNTSMEAEISLLMANQTLVWFLLAGYRQAYTTTRHPLEN
jgi:hypothetical protein